MASMASQPVADNWASWDDVPASPEKPAEDDWAAFDQQNVQAEVEPQHEAPAEAEPVNLEGLQQVNVLYNFDAQNSDELTITENEMVYLANEECDEEGWAVCINAHGQKGYVPLNYLEIEAEAQTEAAEQDQVPMETTTDDNFVNANARYIFLLLCLHRSYRLRHIISRFTFTVLLLWLLFKMMTIGALPNFRLSLLQHSLKFQLNLRHGKWKMEILQKMKNLTPKQRILPVHPQAIFHPQFLIVLHLNFRPPFLLTTASALLALTTVLECMITKQQVPMKSHSELVIKSKFLTEYLTGSMMAGGKESSKMANLRVLWAFFLQLFARVLVNVTVIATAKQKIPLNHP